MYDLIKCDRNLMDNNSKEKDLLYPETLLNLKTKWWKTRSASSAKLLLKKWMILTVLLSNSWLVNYKQPKKNNIGKVLCISWAVEICFYNQRSSKTCVRTSTACSHLKQYSLNIGILIWETLKIQFLLFNIES